ncbi:MAG: magnesium/cobalt transporter CorA [Betaproteobacteria bacterium]|nr:magnesium/cobalt transporter CorA [Betaproteobacteria bacterium]
MLVNCVAYQEGRKLADVPVEAISDYVGRPECFVWVALKDPTPEELAQLQEEFGLHDLAVEDARKGNQRPKLEEYGNSLFAVLHSIDIRAGELHVAEIDLFVGRNFVLSVRQGTEQGFAAVRARTEREPELLRQGAGFVFYALIDAVVDRYFPVVDALEMELESLEGRIFEGATPRANLEALYGLKQKLMTVKHAVDPLIEAVGKLHGGRVPQVCQGTQEYFRDVYDHLLRLSQVIDSLRDTVTTAMSVNVAMISLAESEVTKRLAAYAALVAVPTMIAGIYGMNFKHIPELDWTFGYPLAISAMVAIDVWLFLRFRKARWL